MLSFISFRTLANWQNETTFVANIRIAKAPNYIPLGHTPNNLENVKNSQPFAIIRSLRRVEKKFARFIFSANKFNETFTLRLTLEVNDRIIWPKKKPLAIGKHREIYFVTTKYRDRQSRYTRDKKLQYKPSLGVVHQRRK